MTLRVPLRNLHALRVRRLLLPFVAITLYAQAPTPPPTPSSFHYTRQILTTPGPEPDACAVLDASVFAHANPLEDLRLYTPTRQEIPYTITFSGTAPTDDQARILNLGLKSPAHLSFDLEMPSRAYSSLALTLNAQDYLASAKITGLKSLTDKSPTYLGDFSLFDLTAQRLGHNSSLQFAESTFPYLHLELTFTPAPGKPSLAITPAIVTVVEIPPSRLAQTLYTPIAETTTITQRPRESVATFTVPARVPVERISFNLDPADPTNFSRTVTISSKENITKEGEPGTEQLSGQISRLRLTEAGQQIRDESLSIPAILASNEQAPATVEVAIQNGDDQPIHLRSVTLEMRQRKLCYPVQPDPVTLMYGAPAVAAPLYDFGRLFNVSGPIRPATLTPEQFNPTYLPPTPRAIPFTERYPQLLWIALLTTITLLAVIAFRSARRIG